MYKIGIIGKLCSGKTTVAKSIKFNLNKLDFKICSFGLKVKEIACELFNMDMNNKNRLIMQSVGTKMREIDENVWVNYIINSNKDKNIIVDDVRYLNEFSELKKNNTIFIKLELSKEEQLKRLKKYYPDNWEKHYENTNHQSETEHEKINNIDIHIKINVDKLTETEVCKEVLDKLIKFIYIV